MPRTGRPREFDETTAIATAANVFRARGYQATSVADLVDALGVHRASLYGAFGDKYGLYVRALEHYTTAVTAMVTATLDREGPVVPRIREILLAGLPVEPGTPGPRCLLGSTAMQLPSDDPAVNQSTRSGFAAVEAAFRRALQRARDTGEIGPGDDAAQAQLLVVLMQGIQVIAQADPDPRRLTAVVDAALVALRASR